MICPPRTGNVSGGPAGAATAPQEAPTYATAATSVVRNIFRRVGALVQRSENHLAYTHNVGQDLGVAAVRGVLDPQSAKPELTLTLVQGGRVQVGWTKGGPGALRIEVDRGQGWQFLATDTVPDYTDTAPLPSAGQSGVRKCRGIYVLDNQPVGQWSDPVSLAVMGVSTASHGERVTQLP